MSINELLAEQARGRAACRAACSASGAPPERALFLALDLESCASVRAFAAQLLATCGRCDALICNDAPREESKLN